ncbi:MAG: trypsin-like peptidase domain-containing protein [Phycisphaerales bacterium]|nr:trypsin-like peptidase domain-containing protein [Phycisphaerales bacterium]MCB9857653.1 trypsin-like peptidase domain-containing protein [Phycisphaerales bacterium]
MQSAKPWRNALLAVLTISATILVIEQSQLLERAAYALERGRLEANFDHLKEIPDADIEGLEKVSQGFAVVAETVKPAVVYIDAVAKRVEVDPQMEELFRRYDFGPARGTGSGAIFDDRGYIVTNNHVVADADAVRVTLADGRRFNADVVGTDPKTDLAVLKINADRLHAARFGDSEKVRVGHLVLAIGSPFRLGHSVSHGIISAIGRSDVNVDIDYQDWFQTDAAINPGNSGGPLINSRGEIIGINTAIATESGANQGVAFAIPSNIVKDIVGKLQSGKEIVRGYLGVQIEQVDPRIASAFGLAEAEGVLVRGVGQDTPADKAGIRPEDIILAIGNRRVTTRERLQHLIARIEPGTNTDITVWRKGHEIVVQTRIQAQPRGFSTTGSLRDLVSPPESTRSNRPPESIGAMRELPQERPGETLGGNTGPARVFRDLGFEASTVTPELSKKYDLPDEIINGVIVTRVYPTGDAYESGLRPGQVITMANDKQVNNIAEFEQHLTPEAIRKGIRIHMKWRGSDQFTVLISK